MLSTPTKNINNTYQLFYFPVNRKINGKSSLVNKIALLFSTINYKRLNFRITNIIAL